MKRRTPKPPNRYPSLPKPLGAWCSELVFAILGRTSADLVARETLSNRG
jgi:hypothetical protein